MSIIDCTSLILWRRQSKTNKNNNKPSEVHFLSLSFNSIKYYYTSSDTFYGLNSVNSYKKVIKDTCLIIYYYNLY